LAIIRVPGAIGVVMESQVLSEAGHGWIRVLIVDGVRVVPCGGANRREGLLGAPRACFGHGLGRTGSFGAAGGLDSR
jgi:hypothetical protein